MSDLQAKLAAKKPQLSTEETISPPTKDSYWGKAVSVEIQYKPLKRTMLLRGDGTVLRLVGGVYSPETEEELEICAYFEKIGYLVKA